MKKLITITNLCSWPHGSTAIIIPRVIPWVVVSRHFYQKWQMWVWSKHEWACSTAVGVGLFSKWPFLFLELFCLHWCLIWRIVQETRWIIIHYTIPIHCSSIDQVGLLLGETLRYNVSAITDSECSGTREERRICKYH